MDFVYTSHPESPLTAWNARLEALTRRVDALEAREQVVLDLEKNNTGLDPDTDLCDVCDNEPPVSVIEALGWFLCGSLIIAAACAAGS